MVKAITFDCWDTLLADDPSRNIERKRYFGQVLEENGITIPGPAINDLFQREAELFREHIIRTRRTQDAVERTQTLIRLADVELPASEMDRISEYGDRVALEFGPPLVAGIREALEDLSGTYALAIICNTGWHSGKTVQQLLVERDLTRYFSHITFSDEAGLAKPHRQIFEYTVEKLGCRTEDAVHIGDSEYSDIVGAKEANMKAILFAGINDRYKDNNSADVTISTYDHFLEVIDNLR